VAIVSCAVCEDGGGRTVTQWEVSFAMSELRNSFQQRLHDLEVKVIELFAFLREDLEVATGALLTGDGEALKTISERDAIIDDVYQQLEHIVDVELALQAPVATDLRLLLSVLRILPELERSHALVTHIAEQATHILSGELSPRARGLVERMGETAADMWNRAANAWYERDRNAAEVLADRDEDLGSLHAALIAELASGTMSLPVTMDMTLVARYYERLGDHAVNVARRVVYLAGREQRT
jgi:phosphate transport system protein